jgi:hypothetical protein
VGVWSLGSLNQLINNMGWRRLIRIAHAKVDNILAPRTCFCFQIIYNVENIGREAFDSRKLVVQLITCD